MTDPEIVSPDQWLTARKALLVKEKELTRQRDALNAERRQLPMVEITKDYVFTGPSGKASLLDLFDGRRQLIVKHFMFDPEWDAGCPSCSFATDHIGPHLEHLHARDTTWVAVSRAPIEKIEAYRERMGWPIPWYSSYGSDFNYDFHATQDPRVGPLDYNFMDPDQLAAVMPDGTDWSAELPGDSAFLRQGDRVFHTYSQYARGTEPTITTYSWLDLTALGRQEGWEQPPGRGDGNHGWLRRHDEY